MKRGMKLGILFAALCLYFYYHKGMGNPTEESYFNVDLEVKSAPRFTIDLQTHKRDTTPYKGKWVDPQ